MKVMTTFVLCLFIMTSITSADNGAFLPYPPTRQAPVTETIHGEEITDPYRWLEGDENGGMTPEVSAWTDAQNALTRQVLDNLPGRAELEARLTELFEVGYTGMPTVRGNRYFYSQREGQQNQAVIMVREGLDGEPRVLLDPNELNKDGLLTIAWTRPSLSGKLLAFGVFEGGSENTVLHLMDVETGQWLDDKITGRVRIAAWLPGDEYFVYRGLESEDDPYSGRVQLHKIGRDPKDDPILFEQYKEGPHAKTWGPYASLDPRLSRWMLLGYSTGQKNNDLWAADWQQFMATGQLEKIEIAVGENAGFHGRVIGDDLYMLTTLDAPNGKIVKVNLLEPARENWEDFLPEREGYVIDDLSIAADRFFVQYLHNASTIIEMFKFDGTSLGPLELPGIGSAGVGARPESHEIFLSYTSFNQPRTIYRIDLKTGERTIWEQPDIPVDPSRVEVKQVWYPSKDGTQVSMFIVHRKDIKLDGNNPTILYGYGGFDISMTPHFSSTMFPWYESGGIYAIVNLRGGGEYGKAWHEAGTRENKQNVFDDFIAAAEWLIENKYTRSEKLGIAGGSNGGLLTGAAVTQRPDLFAAAISSVPLLDMVRYHQFLMGRYWVPEYGSSEDPEQFEYLYRYSPYHRIKPDVKYPAVFLTAGENDARVHPLHARKMAAALQQVAQQNTNAKPVLLWVERQSGHGGGKPLWLSIRDITDTRLFMMWQLGMLEGNVTQNW